MYGTMDQDISEGPTPILEGNLESVVTHSHDPDPTKRSVSHQVEIHRNKSCLSTFCEDCCLLIVFCFCFIVTTPFLLFFCVIILGCCIIPYFMLNILSCGAIATSMEKWLDDREIEINAPPPTYESTVDQGLPTYSEIIES